MWFQSSCTDKSQFTDFNSSKFELLKFIYKQLLHNFAKSYIISGVQFFEIVKILFLMKISIVDVSLFWFNAFLYYIKLLLNYNPIDRWAQWGALLGVPSSIFSIMFVTVFISCFASEPRSYKFHPHQSLIIIFLSCPNCTHPYCQCTVRTLALTKIEVMGTAYKFESTCVHCGAPVQCFVTDISSSAS